MENQKIKDRYLIKNKIGEGGMGKTYLAHDEQENIDVVVKILHFQRAEDWKVIELFEREAKVLKSLDHPYIPDYIDSFHEDSDSDRNYYLVQEYVEGKNLQEKIEDGWHCTEDEAKSLLEKLLSILAYLQDLRPPVIHRDINPKNIIMKPNGDVYLVDFGAVQDTVRANIMGGSTVVGTYGYMPMEQMMGKAIPSSDLYALGVTMIYVLSHLDPSNIPFKNMKLDYRSSVHGSPALLRVIDALIEPDAAKRPQDAENAIKMLQTGRVPRAGRSGTRNREAQFDDSFDDSKEIDHEDRIDWDHIEIPYQSKI